MSLNMQPRRILLASAALITLIASAVAYGILRRNLRTALADSGQAARPLQFAPLQPPSLRIERWGSGEIEAVATTASSLLTAGSSGVADEGGDLSPGLPTLRVSALTIWRGRPVAGLASGGLFLRRNGCWEEARTGFGTLHVRALLEGPGGELFIGAQEGLFRTPWGARKLERLDSAPVRSLSLSPGGALLAGGEQGLRNVASGRITPLPAPDSWVDWVGQTDKEICVLTPQGLASGPPGTCPIPLAGGQDITSAAVLGSQIYGISRQRLLRFSAGKASEERLPSPPRRVFTCGNLLLADTEQGLYARTTEGWTLARPRPTALPPGSCHVSALAFLGSRVMVGLFDGGLLQGDLKGATWNWRSVPGSEAWGVNALLPAGGALYIASLRGAARYDGRRLATLEGGGAGSAYALAPTSNGVAIGYAQGLLLPGSHFLSAFHGLPGNQTLALASGANLFVGTPSGLGAVSGERVAWRVTAGEGKLPHPWITALSLSGDTLYIGTYGGGVTRRTAAGTFLPYPETQGFKINPGCLVQAGSRMLLGTDGRGLYGLNRDGSRFLPIPVPLPSPRVTAILPAPDGLYVGTDEGLAKLPLSILHEGA